MEEDFYHGLDHVYLRLVTFREMLLSSLGKVMEKLEKIQLYINIGKDQD